MLAQVVGQRAGVSYAYANRQTEMVYVIYVPTQIDPQQLVMLI